MELVIHNSLEDVSRLCDAVEAFCSQEGIEVKKCHNILLVLDELVTNTIVHGFSQGVGGKIVVRFGKNGSWEGKEESLRIEIIDDALAFNPLEKATPDIEASLEDRKIGGLGIYLVRQFSKNLTYRREDGKNILTIDLCLAS